MDRFAAMLRDQPYVGSPEASDLYDEIQALAA
jgi:hypothetical protein